MGELGFEFAPLGFVVSLDPGFDGGEHAHDFFFADFHGAAEGVVGSAVGPGGLEEGFVAEEEASGLRPADALATAVGDGCGATAEVDVGDGENFGGGINEDWDVVFLRDGGDSGCAEGAVVFGAGEDVDHGRAAVDGGLELSDVADLDDLDAKHADAVIVLIAGVGGDDDFVAEAGKIGEALHALRVEAGNGGGGEVGEAGAAAVGDDGPGGLGDFGDAAASTFHEFVEVDVMAGGFGHCLLYFWKGLRAGDDGEGAPGVDDGADTDGFIEGGAEFEWGGFGCLGGGEEATGAEEVATRGEGIPESHIH